jgi:DNA ligase-associated metallophosphoesterase
MHALAPHQAIVAPNVLLDGRLALFHKREKWLAIADLHFGYELSQRAAGRLVPMWGMETAADRLLQLLHDYSPQRLIIIGDLVHDRTAARVARELLAKLNDSCETIVIAGNHDRQIASEIEMLPALKIGRFYFHHGHCARRETNGIQIIGHHHPAGVLRDGAGLRLKCPAFVQQERCWIMPAFSPWAAGANWPHDEPSRVWLCTPQRVLLVRDPAKPERALRFRARSCNAGNASL